MLAFITCFENNGLHIFVQTLLSLKLMGLSLSQKYFSPFNPCKFFNFFFFFFNFNPCMRFVYFSPFLFWFIYIFWFVYFSHFYFGFFIFFSPLFCDKRNLKSELCFFIWFFIFIFKCWYCFYMVLSLFLVEFCWWRPLKPVIMVLNWVLL